MQKHIRNLKDSPEETNRRAANTLDDVEEGAPLLRDISDEEDDDSPVQANGGSS